MKKETSEALCFIFLEISVILIIILIFSISFFNAPQEEVEEMNTNSEEEIIENCKNLSLKGSAECLRNSLKSIYIYNKTDDNLKLTFEEMKERGGDCRDWAFLYEKFGSELGFNATTVRNGGVKELYKAHRYAVMWDEENYCRLDLMHVKCWEREDE